MAKVYCFGNTSNGELGLGGIEEEHILLPRKQRLVVDHRKYSLRQLSAGRNHTLVLFRNDIADRTLVLSCGANDRNQLGREGSWKRFEVVDALNNHAVLRLCCGSNHSLALTEDGQLLAWGCNLFGQLGIGDTGSESVAKAALVKRLAVEVVVQIACGGGHSLALTKRGVVYAWGSNAFGQLGNGRKGHCVKSPIEIECLSSVAVRGLACGGSHSVALSYTGALYLWGKNEFGQLGVNDLINRTVPTLQTTLREQRIVFVDCGDEHTVALTAEGGLFTWGAGMYGQLGHSKTTNEILPRRVFELMGSAVTQVSCGRCHTMATVGTRGRVYTFGLNGSGQLGIGTQVSKCVPMRVVGQWSELGHTELTVRQMAGSLLPVVTDVKVKVNDINTESPPNRRRRQNPAAAAQTHDMPIDELSDSEDVDSDAILSSSDETAIIEEPEEQQGSPTPPRPPGFVCTTDTIMSRDEDNSLSIAEWEDSEDADSDVELSAEREHIVLREVFASRGDQSFVIVVRRTIDSSRALDVRCDRLWQHIYRLDEWRPWSVVDMETQTPAMEDMEFVEKALTSIACWNASFVHLEAPLPAIDWSAAEKLFAAIESANHVIKDLVLHSMAKMVRLLPNINDECSSDVEVLRVYLLAPFVFRTDYKRPEVMRSLISGYFRAVSSLTDFAIEGLMKWLNRLDERHLRHLLAIAKSVVVELLAIQDRQNRSVGESTPNQLIASLHESLSFGLEFLSLLHRVNQKSAKLSYKEFYINDISNWFDLKTDYLCWLGARARGGVGVRGGQGQRTLFLCDFPFIFDPSAKTQILDTDSRIQQYQAMANDRFQLPLLGSDPHFVLSVRRQTILADTINHLCVRHLNPSDFKKPLRVSFEGEEAIDAGQGVKKEFFLLLIREFLDPKYGLFNAFEETNAIWFNPCLKSVEKEDLVIYELIGIVCGLALYNQVIICLPFPLALFKKLLEEPLALEDLYSLDPVLANSLKDIDSADGVQNADEFNALFGDLVFTATLTCFGSPVEYELGGKGCRERVTYDNRREYVSLYWRHILDHSVEEQFQAFRAGFRKVLNSHVLGLFHAEELMQLVSGQEVSDWVALEVMATEYKTPFSASHPTIALFWRVFHSLSVDHKKQFLLFLTGSDRMPLLGIRAMKIVIQPMHVSEEHLPVAHTCFNVLDLPEHYSSEEKLRSKLLLAIEHIHVFSLA